MKRFRAAFSLARYLCQMKIEVSYRIMKQLLERHEFIKVRIPLCGVVHAAFPFTVLDGIRFLLQGKIGPVVKLSNPLARKHFSLSASAQGIDPVEGTGQCIQQPGEPSG